LGVFTVERLSLEFSELTMSIDKRSVSARFGNGELFCQLFKISGCMIIRVSTS
jgi:hypothetical protein